MVEHDYAILLTAASPGSIPANIWRTQPRDLFVDSKIPQAQSAKKHDKIFASSFTPLRKILKTA